MKYLSIYSIFFKQYLKRLMEYRVDFIIGMFAFILSQSAGLLFLYIIFQNIQSLAGFGIYEILMMYGIGLIPKGIDHLFFDNLWLLPRAVRQGTVDRYLLRPISPLYAFLIERFQPDAFGEIVLGTALLIVSFTKLGVTLMWFEVIGLILLILLGIFVFTSLKLLTSSTSFWLKNSYPLMQVTYDLSDYTKYPILIYPKAIQLLITFVIPFALISYYPTLFILNQASFFFVFAYLVVVISILGSLGLFVWSRGLKHYESTGS